MPHSSCTRISSSNRPLHHCPMQWIESHSHLIADSNYDAQTYKTSSLCLLNVPRSFFDSDVQFHKSKLISAGFSGDSPIRLAERQVQRPAPNCRLILWSRAKNIRRLSLYRGGQFSSSIDGKNQEIVKTEWYNIRNVYELINSSTFKILNLIH